ncbi:Oligopeptidase A [hydrothermal vent metagenome]|uniref:oligopeptidase A n=1 Tax=hydrothermal vent metagenome TaxID=652676 RepID=A0A3B1B8T7_9ZZZZ
MRNPLLNIPDLPPFSKIKPEHVEPAIDSLLAAGHAQINNLLSRDEPPTWQNLVQPLDEQDDQLGRAWSPISHMNSVVNSDELRQAYNACLPKLSKYATEIGQNEKLFTAYKAIVEKSDSLDLAQQKVLQNALRDFHLSGVDLPPAEKARYKDIQQELAKLTSKFEENVLDATNAWTKLITNKEELAGLPESALGLAKQTAEQREKEGWMLTLDFPSYMPVMSYADNRELRHEMYQAFTTRASDQGPHAGKWDNSEIMEQLLSLRHELAGLLNFSNYAERSLATKMARSTEEVVAFLTDLAQRSRSQAQQELAELQTFALTEFGVEELAAWDIGYYAEKLRQHRYAFTQEELKPYFPETRVIPGLFAVVERLFGIQIREIKGVDTWHQDVRFFAIQDQQGKVRGQFYLDLYARQKKRGGAWMDDYIGRMVTPSKQQNPVAYLTCNFSPPVGNQPALFTHNEVETLFHEFGHGLHHMLTRIDYPSVSGINGVAWDAVELPSQFLENWCWEREALELISGHYETGKPLPDKLYNKMYAAKNFQSAMQMVRQLELSLFDFRIHLEYDPDKGGRIYEILHQVRNQVAVVKTPPFNRFAHGFSHIFAGGYGAGYYSYKWAEVLSADAFSLFEKHGIFDPASGESFLHNILEQGGSQDAMQLFIAFRGREPKIDALLRHSGITG